MRFGLIGRSLPHSFSRSYFEKKFLELDLKSNSYENFELKSIDEFPELVEARKDLSGLNVTVPYKEEVIALLDEVDQEAKQIGAVNCINIINGKTKGYNTDVYGFRQSIKPFLEPKHHKALILGTGGSSKAVAYALKQIGVGIYFVTSGKKKNDNTFFYNELNEIILSQFLLIVNCTPLGMFPNVNDCPDIPYQFISSDHLVYDVIYNPEETLFLKKCKQQGATTINGLSMLHLQAEKSWEIWNSN